MYLGQKGASGAGWGGSLMERFKMWANNARASEAAHDLDFSVNVQVTSNQVAKHNFCLWIQLNFHCQLLYV